MADRADPRPPARYRPRPGTDQLQQRETAEERRSRQTATALATQVDLKREAAERRERKSSS